MGQIIEKELALLQEATKERVGENMDGTYNLTFIEKSKTWRRLERGSDQAFIYFPGYKLTGPARWTGPSELPLSHQVDLRTLVRG